MLRNYIKIAWRNIVRNKGFSAINILSLTIGLFGCLVIGLFVYDELQYDKTIPDSVRIYRLYNERTDQDAVTKAAVVSPMYATFLKQQYPEVDTTARIMMIGDKYLMETGDKLGYEEKGVFVDPSFFSIFPAKFVYGNADSALSSKLSIVVSQNIAEKYFGKQDPVGKTIKVNKDDFIVKGVIGELPNHFHLNYRYLMPIAALELPEQRMQSWTWNQFYTYVKLKPGADVSKLQEKFRAYIKKDIIPTLTQDGTSFKPFFQPLQKIHLQSSDFVYDNANRGNETYVKGLSLIALFVLIIACFNFINLATARSFKRAKEIGVRKVIGADRQQIIFQFISETVLLSFFSILVAAIATWLLVPSLNSFTDKGITFNPFTSPVLLLVLLVSPILIGILAGLYPAFVLSGFQPIKVLKSMKPTGSALNTGWLRQSLVVVQFALSALLIISSIVVYRQIKFMNNKELGFNKEQLLYFQVYGDVEKKLEIFKSELKRSPAISSITSGYGLPGDQYAGDGVKINTNEGEKDKSANVFIGDHDYVKTLGLQIIAGRDFLASRPLDTSDAFIINETAVKEFGYGTPQKAIGQPIGWQKWIKDSINPIKRGTVIGVVKDFHYKSLHEKVTASVIQIYPPVTFKVAVKIKTADIQNTIAYINGVWNKFSPGYPLDYKFMDETYGAMYKSEEKLGSLMWIFTIMAIVVGCLGLFALAACSAEQRTKEIGIRKVLGATTANIVSLLSKNFLLLVFVSSIIAFPFAGWAMNNWLADFPYRVNISWWVFAIAAIAALVIALITVSFQAIKAAISNPVKSLRTE